MAIQPDISLHAAPTVQFDPVGSMTKAVSLKKLMTEQEFQRPTIEANLAASRASTRQTELASENQRIQNEQAARELATKKAMAEVLKKHSAVDPKTGKITVDFGAAADEAISGGHDIATVHNFIAKDAENAKARINNLKDANDYANTMRDRAMNAIRVAPPEQVPAILQSTKLAAEQALGKVMKPEEVLETVNGMFGLPASGPAIDPATGKPDIAGTVTQLKGLAETYAASTITPQQAIANKQAQQNIEIAYEAQRQSGALGGVDAAGRDPNSAQSKASAATLAKEGIIVPKGMSHAQMMNNPQWRAILEQSVVGSGAKTAAIETSHALEAKAVLADRWAEAAKKVKHLNLTPAAILSGKVDSKIKNDPAYIEYESVIEQMKAAGVAIPEQAPAAAASAAKKMSEDFRKQAKENAKLVTSPTFNAATEGGNRAKGSTMKRGGETYMKINDGPDNDPKNWKKQ